MNREDGFADERSWFIRGRGGCHFVKTKKQRTWRTAVFFIFGGVGGCPYFFRNCIMLVGYSARQAHDYFPHHKSDSEVYGRRTCIDRRREAHNSLATAVKLQVPGEHLGRSIAGVNQGTIISARFNTHLIEAEGSQLHPITAESCLCLDNAP